MRRSQVMAIFTIDVKKRVSCLLIVSKGINFEQMLCPDSGFWRSDVSNEYNFVDFSELGDKLRKLLRTEFCVPHALSHCRRNG